MWDSVQVFQTRKHTCLLLFLFLFYFKLMTQQPQTWKNNERVFVFYT